jgi:hypothetical protein
MKRAASGFEMIDALLCIAMSDFRTTLYARDRHLRWIIAVEAHKREENSLSLLSDKFGF